VRATGSTRQTPRLRNRFVDHAPPRVSIDAPADKIVLTTILIMNPRIVIRFSTRHDFTVSAPRWRAPEQACARAMARVGARMRRAAW